MFGLSGDFGPESISWAFWFGAILMVPVQPLLCLEIAVSVPTDCSFTAKVVVLVTKEQIDENETSLKIFYCFNTASVMLLLDTISERSKAAKEPEKHTCTTGTLPPRLSLYHIHAGRLTSRHINHRARRAMAPESS